MTEASRWFRLEGRVVGFLRQLHDLAATRKYRRQRMISRNAGCFHEDREYVIHDVWFTNGGEPASVPLRS